MGDQEAAILGGARKEIVAALEEMKFWLRIMQEHAGLIRNGLDPTEEKLFREANRFFQELGPLRMEAEALMRESPGRTIEDLITRSLKVVERLRDFKRNLTALIRECRILTILPADLIDHIRREADFFIGTLQFVRGEPTPTRDTIGVPDGGKRALTIPRLLIPDRPEKIEEIALEETLFWLRINMEHADVLALYFRPGVQDNFVRVTRSHGDRLREVYHEALEVNKSRVGLDRLLVRSRSVVGLWEAFLRQLFELVSTCKVPTGQTNLWPILDDHLAREALYYLEVLRLVEQGSRRGIAPGFPPGHLHPH